MKILSSFTHPVVPNLYEYLCSTEHKGRYSEECGKQSSSGTLLTSIVFCFPLLLWVGVYRLLSGVQQSDGLREEGVLCSAGPDAAGTAATPKPRNS